MGVEESTTIIFAVRTTVGQERNVSNLITGRAEANRIPLRSILVPETLKGYIFIEANGPHIVEEAIMGIKHVRSRVPGVVSFAEVEKYVVVRPIIEECRHQRHRRGHRWTVQEYEGKNYGHRQGKRGSHHRTA